MTQIFDTIVLGVGGMGSATLAELARRGERVLGLEQFPLLHDKGSSHGHTRMIRLAYYEHPDYVPILRRAFERWHDLERETGAQLLNQCGVLTMGPPTGELVAGIRETAIKHNLKVDNLTATEVMKRWPQWKLTEDLEGVFEQVAGFLFVEECNRLHQQVARQHGAQIQSDEPVIDYTISPNSVTVRTAKNTYQAARLVITTGPWATKLLSQLKLPLTVMRQVALWFGTNNPEQFSPEKFPGYICQTPNGEFYGFPVIDSTGAKAAQHYGANELSGPELIDRETHAADEAPVRAFMQNHLPGINGPLQKSSVCIYTLSPDRHFIIDHHPEHKHVVLATGFSGHGFKFTSVVGEILSDLLLSGITPLPIKMFAINRYL